MGDNLQARLEFLRANQNADGGWGYFPGRQSWLEPTGWAAIALHGDPASAKAWNLIKTWQNSDGSCRPCTAVKIPNWTAALAVANGVLQKDRDAVQRGVSYLLDTAGEDSTWMARFAKLISPGHTDRNPKFKGWPWRPGNSSWIEPTTHGITALRLAGRVIGESKVKDRIESAQNMILHQRCKDGGWNYGATTALETPLASFPETTGLALIGLIGRGKEISASLDKAEQLLTQKQSPLSRAWLSLALRMHGRNAPALDAPASEPDLLLTAIESLDWRLLA